jgi:proteic killer suppression protein
MIVSFGDRATEDLYHDRPTSRARRFPRDIVDLALVKLDMIAGASATLDLRSPPGNRLEVLKGDRKGFHSIRVNEQWRIVFRWEGTDAHAVSLVDYHG